MKKLKSYFSKILIKEDNKSQKEILTILKSAVKHKVLDRKSYDMIEGVLNISKYKVRDIMVPRSQMVVLEETKTLKEILQIIIDSTHSRFPVIAAESDNIIGILLAKDLLKNYILSENKPQKLTKQLLRPAVFIPESMHLSSLLKDFRTNHNHLALVIDEYGNVSGLITIEDVLEEIVGDIEDEFDIEQHENIKQIAKKQYLINSLTLLEEFNEHFDTNLGDNNSDTVGGFIINKLERIPGIGENISIDNLIFKITQATRRHIKTIRLSVK